MLYYIGAYLFFLFFYAVSYCLDTGNIERNFLFFLGVLPATLLVVLRGNIGTDTLAYLDYFRDLANSADVYAYEPGFVLVARCINFLGFGERFGVAAVGACTIMLLLHAFSADKYRMGLFVSLLFPIFFFDMTMNGIRYGLSFALCANAIQYLYRRKMVLFFLFAFFSISVQYSSLVIIFPFFLFNISKKSTIPLLGFMVVISPVLISFVLTHLDYFYSKQDFYRDVAAPGAISGIAPLFLFLTLFLIFYLYLDSRKPIGILLFILVFQMLSFLLARITYAGLRFQLLFLFMLILLVQQYWHQISKKKEFLLLTFVVGGLGFLITLKNLSGKIDDIQETFGYVPYRFFWEEN